MTPQYRISICLLALAISLIATLLDLNPTRFSQVQSQIAAFILGVGAGSAAMQWLMEKHE